MGGSGGGGQEFPRYISEAHYGIVTNYDYGDPDHGNQEFFTDGTTDNPNPPDDPLQTSLREVLQDPYGPLAAVGSPYSYYYNPATNQRYRPQEYPDLKADLQSVDNAFSNYEAALGGRGAEADFASILLKAATEVDIAGRLNDVDMLTLRTFITGGVAADMINANVFGRGVAEAWGTSDGEPAVSIWQDYIDAVKAKIDEAGILTTVDWDAIKVDAVTDAGTLLAAALAANNTGIDEETEWGSYVDTIVAKLASCGVLDDIEVPTLFQNSLTQATRSITEAVEAAMEIINDDMLEPVVAGYEQRQSYQKGKAVRLFTGQMADINAENSSAFLIGLALIEAQHQADIAKFDADLTLAAYQEAVRQHGAALQEYFKTGLAAASENLRARSQLFLQALSNLSEMHAGRVKFEQALVQYFQAGFSGHVDAEVDVDKTNKTQRDQALLQGISSMDRVFSAAMSTHQAMAGLYNQLLISYMDDWIETAKAEKVARDSVLSQGVQQMGVDLYRKHDMQLNYARFDKEITALRVAYEREKFQDDLDLQSKVAMWPIFVMEHASNVLAGPSGMAGIVPPEMSKTQSVLGGAAAGAGIGVAIGGPVGAGIGAGVGGLAGLFG